MKIRENYIIAQSLTEVCRWLNKTDVEITAMIPIKGVYNEDCVRIEYVYKKNEEEE